MKISNLFFNKYFVGFAMVVAAAAGGFLIYKKFQNVRVSEQLRKWSHKRKQK